MLGLESTFGLLEKALGYSEAQETDVYLNAQELGLSRFAGGAIHQSVAHSNVTLNIRSVAGKRLGRVPAQPERRPPPARRRSPRTACRSLWST